MEHVLFAVPTGGQNEQIAGNSFLYLVSARHEVPGRVLSTHTADTIIFLPLFTTERLQRGTTRTNSKNALRQQESVALHLPGTWQ